MRRLAFAFVLVLGPLGCGDADTSADDGSSSGTGATTTTTETTATTPSTATVSGSATTDATTDDVSSSTGVDATDGSSTAVDATTDTPGDCAFEPAVDEAISESTSEPIDCGFVGLDDTVDAWEAARQCARDATLDQSAYKVLWQWQDGDTVRDAAFASAVGEIYAIYRFDDDAASGTSSITVMTCTGISTADECVVAVGQICIDCIEPGAPAELCE